MTTPAQHPGSVPSLHILHVIDGINVGGGEIVLAQLVERLQAAGHRNTVVALTTAGIIGQRMADAGARLLTLDMRRLSDAPGALRQLIRTIRDTAPDVIQGWMYHGNLAASLGRRLARSPAGLAWSIHNSVEPMPSLPLVTEYVLRLEQLGSVDPAAIVYVSAASAAQHERLGFRADRTCVIPNGTDCARFRRRTGCRERLRASLGVTDDRPLLGLFARWHPMKGHTVLFDAVGQLRQTGRPVHLVLAGTGLDPQNAELAGALEAAGVVGEVSLLGARGDVEMLLAGLDLFVLPSVDGEAFPLVLGEAMAAGVPCVATDIGDCRMIVGDTGTIVPPGDLAALVAACERLLDAGPATREQLGQNARQRIANQFSLERTAEVYADLYRWLAGRKRRPQPRRVPLGPTG
jgi:glycosyltransferase involved in cell wall biosynthesis